MSVCIHGVERTLVACQLCMADEGRLHHIVGSEVVTITSDDFQGQPFFPNVKPVFPLVNAAAAAPVGPGPSALARAGLSAPEPPPKPSDHPAVWDLVAQDFRVRDMSGSVKYGVRLRAHNGRDALKDAYQEAMDLVVYLRQAIYERDGR